MARRECKVVVLGTGGVGKSTSTIQFVQNVFVEEYDPTIEDSYRKAAFIDNQNYLLTILDTAGQDKYNQVRPSYAIGEGFVGMYSITTKYSVDELVRFLEQLQRLKEVNSFPLVIVGNKCDLESEREITTEEALKLAKRFNATFFETSAKLRINIDQIFHEIVRQIVTSEHRKQQEIKRPKQTCFIF